MMPKEDRQLVCRRLDVNMVVEAGAGTGKTKLLIDRLCLALLAQDIPAPRLVALTFTEKAAAEIKTRLVSSLQTVLREAQALQRGDKQETNNEMLKDLRKIFSVPLLQIIERAEKALGQLDRSPIGTIHGFGADILRMYPLEAGLTPGAEIDKGPRAQAVFEEEWHRFLDKELGVNAVRAEQWKKVLSHMKLSDLRACAQEMCGGKTSGYDYFGQKELLAKVCEERAKRAEELAVHFSEGKKAPRVLEKALFQAVSRFENAAAWLRTGRMPEADEETIIVKSVPKDWDEASVDEAETLLSFSRQANPFVQQLVLAAYDLLSEPVRAVRRRCQQEGILSFDDLLIKTRDLLRDNLLVRRYLQEEYDALYIDEFQDTDPAQGELLLFLAEEKGHAARDWSSVKLQAGKLFVVGDPKQSIYHFRGADITAYQLFTDLILKQGGIKAYLRRNFRSKQEIVALANGVCGRIMEEKIAFQPAYEPIFTANTSRNGAAEMALVFRAEDTVLAEEGRQNQGRFVAQWIRENVGKLTLQDGHKLQYRDIALLSRAATTLPPFTDALRREDVPFSVEEDRDFYRRQEINDFLNFLRAADDPRNRIALVGTLRSPLGGLSDEEIMRLSKAGEMDWRCETQNPKARRLFALLKKFAARSGREPLRELLHGLLNETFLAEACAAAYDGERSIINLQKLVWLAEGYSLQTPSTLGQFLSRVQEMMEQELGRLTALPEGEALDAVSVMTVHKSKGLQFPVVILADISKKDKVSAAQRASHLYSWRNDLHGFRVGPYADINLAWLEEEQKEHDRCEEMRILYVALTRAQEKLLIVGNAEANRYTMADMFARAGYWPASQQYPETLGAENELRVTYIPYQKPEEFIYQHRLRPAVQENKRETSAWRTAYAARMAEYERLSAQKEILTPSQLGREEQKGGPSADIGTLVHAALAHYWQGEKDAALCVRRAANETALTACGHVAKEIMDAFCSSELCARLRQMRVLETEMPFSRRTSQGIVNGVIDLLLRDENETVWVVDFKTDETDDWHRRAEIYRPQVQAYVQAMEQLYPHAEIKGAVAFVRSARWVELF